MRADPRPSARVRWTSAGAAVVAAGHAGPALSAIGPVRRAFLSRLAGGGRPGHVALTFDDGPDRRSTPAFLETLDRLGWRATFFMPGAMVDPDPGLARQGAAPGHPNPPPAHAPPSPPRRPPGRGA